MKSTLKRFPSLVLCMCMVMALLPNVTMTAFAATSGTVTGLSDENVGLSLTVKKKSMDCQWYDNQWQNYACKRKWLQCDSCDKVNFDY